MQLSTLLTLAASTAGLSLAAPAPAPGPDSAPALAKRSGSWVFSTYSDGACNSLVYETFAASGSQQATQLATGGRTTHFKWSSSTGNAGISLFSDTGCKNFSASATTSTGCIELGQPVQCFAVIA